MKSKSLMLMVLSMGFGLIAAIGISQVMGRSKASAQPVVKMGPVLVAADHLDLHSKLTSDNIKIENWPANIIPENAATTIEELEGMVNTTRLTKGMPLVLDGIDLEKNIGILSIPPGFKVVAVKVSGDVSGLLTPGSKVDVIGFFKKRGRTGQTQTTSKTFLKGLQVFSVNNNMNAIKRDQLGSGAGNAIVGVLVNEKQSEEIYYVQKTGEIKLVLRGDFQEGDDETDSLDDIMQWDEESQLAEDFPAAEQPPAMEIKQPMNATMVIWDGPEPRLVKLEQGSLPSQTGPVSSLSTADDEDYENEEDSGDFSGSEEDSLRSQQDQ